MDCGMSCVKYLLFAFNLLFFIVALVLIGVGAAIEIKYKNVAELTGNTISSAPILLICIGVFILIIAFFGCCGAYKENYCMVTTFAVLMIFIFILEIAAGITAFALRNKVESWITKKVQSSISEFKPANAVLFDKVQDQFKCCGALNAQDWANSKAFQAMANETIRSQNISPAATLRVPDSCCRTVTKNCGLTKGHNIYNGTADGCVNKIEVFIKRNAGIIGGVGLGIAAMQVVGIIFACCLMRSIKKQYEVV